MDTTIAAASRPCVWWPWIKPILRLHKPEQSPRCYPTCPPGHQNGIKQACWEGHVWKDENDDDHSHLHCRFYIWLYLRTLWPGKSIDPYQPYGSLMAAPESLALFKTTRNLWFLWGRTWNYHVQHVPKWYKPPLADSRMKHEKALSIILSFRHVLNLVSLSQIFCAFPFHSIHCVRVHEVSSTLAGQQLANAKILQGPPRFHLRFSSPSFL